jgi:hypothetical protein
MARNPRLTLAENSGEFRHCEFAEREHAQQPQPARIGQGAKSTQQLVSALRHCLQI